MTYFKSNPMEDIILCTNNTFCTYQIGDKCSYNNNCSLKICVKKKTLKKIIKYYEHKSISHNLNSLT